MVHLLSLLLVSSVASVAASNSSVASVAESNSFDHFHHIYLIRHGEKKSNGCESATGMERAHNLYDVFKERFQIPSQLFAFKYHAGECQRCKETVEPIAKKLDVKVDFHHGDNDCHMKFGECQKFADSVKRHASQGVVLVVAEHRHMEYLVYDLGVPQHSIPHWHNSDYDSVFVVKISGDHATLEHKYQTQGSLEVVV